MPPRKHGTRVSFWGGPSDGAKIEEPEELRDQVPTEWWAVEYEGYRLYGVVRHREDDSICAIAYVWKEVWGE
jgi:hypothetical protein